MALKAFVGGKPLGDPEPVTREDVEAAKPKRVETGDDAPAEKAPAPVKRAATPKGGK